MRLRRSRVFYGNDDNQDSNKQFIGQAFAKFAFAFEHYIKFLYTFNQLEKERF